MSLAAGTRRGPYEVFELIAIGGMGEVYKARDIRLDRTVAPKVLPAVFSDPFFESIHLGSLAGGGPKRLLTENANTSYADGHVLCWRDQVLRAQRFYVEREMLTGEPAQIASDVVARRISGPGFQPRRRACSRIVWVRQRWTARKLKRNSSLAGATTT